jgi:hypothetical protein
MSIEESLVKSSFLGRDGYRWWIGQVPPASTPTIDTWGERVPVRIIGYHPLDGAVLPDSDLPLALICKPTTVGSDNRQSSAITGGEIVVGCFIDGDDGQQPLITGYIDKYVNENTTSIQDSLQNNSTELQSVPYSDPARWRILGGEDDPDPLSILSKQGSSANPVGVQTSYLQGGDDTKESAPVPSIPAQISYEISNTSINGPNNCGDDIASRIQVELTKLTIIIKKIKQYYQIYVEGTINKLSNFMDEIQEVIENVAAIMRTLVQRVRNFLLRKLRNLLRDALEIILGDVLKDIRDSVIAKILDAIFCAIQKTIEDLPLLIADFIAALIGRVFSIPICAAEQFINALVNNIILGIEEAISPILDEINDILGGVLEVGGEIFAAIDDILGLFGFLCLEKNCVEITKFRASPFGISIGNEKDNYEKFLNQVTLGDVSGQATDWLERSGFGLTDDFSVFGQGVLGDSSCNTFPATCGPPFIDIFGGNPANQAIASAVVNQAGQVVGALIDNAGSRYLNSPFITFRDPCERGKYASAYGIINAEFGTLDRIVITNPGYGYLPASDGTTSIDAPPSRDDPTFTTQPIETGEVITIPTPSTNTNTISPTPSQPTGTIQIPGDTTVPGSPTETDAPNTITTIPVVGCLAEVQVLSTGYGYSQDDEFIVIPEVPGLELKGKYTEFGQLVSVEISGDTCGFTTIPEIRINSKTGAGVELRASLTFTKASEFTEQESAKYQNNFLYVVQCVSK